MLGRRGAHERGCDVPVSGRYASLQVVSLLGVHGGALLDGGEACTEGARSASGSAGVFLLRHAVSPKRSGDVLHRELQLLGHDEA